ncbi:unnamed protein product [Penicillium olsonii]|nr:unnamed protein product [Penicillium olsonii]CAG7928150.1 unnamed protein product [Penicillium olsonii]
MEMLGLVKGQIAPEVDAFQTVSSMVNKTVQAMNQLKVARKQMMNKSANSSSSTPNQPHTDAGANTRKKRRRVSGEQEQTRAAAEVTPESSREMRSAKRVCDAPSQPPPEQDRHVTPTSLGTEDISAEVQRRLKIKEEQRRKRETPKHDKRKRDSLASNDGASPGATTRPRKKRAKTDSDRKRSGELEENSSRKKLRGTP